MSTAIRIAFVASFAALASGCVMEEEPQPDDAELGESYAQGRVCGRGPTVQGVDVSYYQGRVDWDRVAGAGIGFGFARVSDGTRFIDPRFGENWRGMRRVGILRGAYQFFRPGQDARAQARIMTDVLGKLRAGDLPAVLDIETADGYSSASIRAGMRIWLREVEAATGKKPIIYTSWGFWNSLSGMSEFGDYPLWVANYTSLCPLVPTQTWSGWDMWQYTDTGRVPGVTGNTDRNVWNGTLDELKAFANARDLEPIEVYWSRQADGSYHLRALTPLGVARVEYYVDGYLIGQASREQGENYPADYRFNSNGLGRFFEVVGYDASNVVVARGIGQIDVTADTGVYIKQMGRGLYEIGLERAPDAVGAIEVAADGIVLTDGVSGKRRSTRKAVRTRFNSLGERDFAISTYNADGSLRGTLHRSFTLE